MTITLEHYHYLIPKAKHITNSPTTKHKRPSQRRCHERQLVSSRAGTAAGLHCCWELPRTPRLQTRFSITPALSAPAGAQLVHPGRLFLSFQDSGGNLWTHGLTYLSGFSITLFPILSPGKKVSSKAPLGLPLGLRAKSSQSSMNDHGYNNEALTRRRGRGEWGDTANSNLSWHAGAPAVTKASYFWTLYTLLLPGPFVGISVSLECHHSCSPPTQLLLNYFQLALKDFI